MEQQSLTEELSPRYKLGKPLTESKDTVLYEAKSDPGGVPVILEILDPAASEELIREFKRFAERWKGVRHPNLVSILEIEEIRSLHCLVREDFQGESAKNQERRGKISPQKAVKNAEEIADFWGFISSRGLENSLWGLDDLLIDKEGNVKIATVGDLMDENNLSTSQIERDLLGQVLYFFSTGTSPFKDKLSQNPSSLGRIAPPTPSALNPRLSASLDRIIMGALDPSEKYSPYELLQDLKNSKLTTQIRRRSKADEIKATKSTATVDPPATSTFAKRRRIISYLLKLAIVLIILGVFVGATIWVSNLIEGYLNVGEAKVPDLVGERLSEADKKLRDLKLELKMDEQVYSENFPAGYIMSQDPQAGSRVKEGREIRVIVSLGVKLEEVPKLEGNLTRQAEIALHRSKLKVGGKAYVHHSSIPRGRVIALDPPTGTEVPRETTVNMLISLGPKPRTFPLANFRGAPLALAEEALLKVGLTLGEMTERNSVLVPEGLIIEQKPEFGEFVSEGQEISFVVSKGSPMESEEEKSPSSPEEKVLPPPEETKPPVEIELPEPGYSYKSINFVIPEGEAPVEVKVLLSDEEGLRQIYNRIYEPGEEVTIDLRWKGRGKAQIYLNGMIYQEVDL